MNNLPENPILMGLAGAAGAIVHWITRRQSWQNGLSSLIVGIITAIYLGPVISSMFEQVYFQMTGSEKEMSVFVVGYLAGISGIALNGALIDLAKIRIGSLKGRDDEK